MSDRLIRSLPALASLAVGVASFALSYVALRDVAVDLHAVPAHLGWLVPVVIDGGVIGGSAVLWSHARSGARTPWLAVLIVVVLVSMSVVVNTAHAGPALLAKVIAALPPLVLLGTLELVAAEHRRASRTSPAAGSAAAPSAMPAAPQLQTTDRTAVATTPAAAAPVQPATPATPATPAVTAASGEPRTPSDEAAGRVAAPRVTAAAQPAATDPAVPATVVSMADRRTAAASRAARPDVTTAADVPAPSPVTASPTPVASAASSSAVRPAAPRSSGDTRPASEVIGEMFAAHVADGGDPDDPTLAKSLADAAGVSTRHARRVISRVRDRMDLPAAASA